MSDLFAEAMAGASLWHLAVATAATFVGGFIRGFVGFGGALVSILVISLLLGPKAAVAIATLAGLPAMFQILPAAIRHSAPRSPG